MSGILYIIGTPIGNMEDITLRQLRMLKEVDFLCAEDTRVTMKLLSRYEIKQQLVSFHEHSSRADADRIISRLLSGESCGVVTDAGMPCISDPAAALSGMPISRFTFEGFLPVAKNERSQRLELLRNETAVMVFYEAPHKLRTTLSDLCGLFGGERRIAICREITKLHEEVLRMTLAEACSHYEVNEPKGEYVLVIEGRSESDAPEISLEQALEQVQQLIGKGERPTEACKAVARETGFRKSELYSALK